MSGETDAMREIEVLCHCCHRNERWKGSQHRVIAEGGARVPHDRGRQAMAVLVAHARGQLGPVVAFCPACGQPMTAAVGSAVPAIRVEIPTPKGPLVFDESGVFSLPTETNAADSERAAKWLDDTLPPYIPPEQSKTTWFETALMMMIAVPILVWIFSVLFVVFFLYYLDLPVIQ